MLNPHTIDYDDDANHKDLQNDDSMDLQGNQNQQEEGKSQLHTESQMVHGVQDTKSQLSQN